MAFGLDFEKIEQSRILVIGDVMLDRYLWGEVQRISPEAPVPVFHIREDSEVSGGAGNVVSNLVGLGCSVTVMGVCGDDEEGRRLNKLLDNGKVLNHVLIDPDRPTVTKTRIVSAGQQLLRLDDEEVCPLNSDIQKKLLNSVENSLSNTDAIILSDYGKGTFQTPGFAQSVIKLAQNNNVPIIVDPKGKDWERYKGATCVTPNTKELEQVCDDKIDGKDDLQTAMESIITKYDLSWLLVTRGPLGMCLAKKNEDAIFIPAIAREVYDVSGAGDSVVATLSLGVASGLTFPEAAKLANVAAGIVVGKLGTQPINQLELKASIEINGDGLDGKFINKMASLSAATIQVQAWKANKEKIVFTNGCFDLLHPGHIHLLNRAKDFGDRLIVGLNGDDSIKRLKGATRPILAEADRASLLSSLNSVDLVVVFEEDTPERLISTLRPDVLVKGADYTLEEVVGRKIVESYGGQICLIPTLKGHSTTNLTEKIGLMNNTNSDCQESGVGSQGSGVKSQESRVRSQKTDDR
jgi:D-beta-D-heptose 7-phosphate kinase/D-beta-D-heptose 1-phosphate adenosyltransferase